MKKNNPSSEHRLRPYVRYLVYGQIALQGLLPAALAISPSVQAADNSAVVYQKSLLLPDLTVPVVATPTSGKKDDASNTTLAQNATSLAALSESGNSAAAAQQYFVGQATQKATQEVETWLNQYGNARISINTNASDDFNMDGSSFDFLLPLINNKNALTFMQFDTHYQDSDRLIGNVGVGQRVFLESGWMVGANAFYDQDLTGTTSRAGFGLEAWTDNLKISGNGYVAISDWHNSDELEDYDEKAADGFDVQVDGYLPAYPQLGGKLKYEQYYGENVALFDTDHLQKDPSAVTVGLNYTPVPLVTVGADYKTGQDGMDETELKLDFNYALGVPWSEQVSSDAVAIRRSLAGSRMDFVNRNNDIVMQYRKQEVIKLALPASLNGDVGTTQALTATITSKYGVDRLEWDPSSTLFAAGGKVTRVDLTHYTVTLPDSTGDYRLRGIAYDKKGNASNTAETLFNATQPASTATIDVDKTQLTVNQNATYTLTAIDAKGAPLPGAKIVWNNHAFGSFSQQATTTDASGKATAILTSSLAGVANVSATVNDGKAVDAKPVTFTADATTAKVVLEATPGTNIAADGSSSSTLTATVKDANGNPVSTAITWATDKSTSQLVDTQGTTDPKTGKATARLTDTVAETATVTVTIPAGTTTQATKSVTFVASTILVVLDTDKTSVAADGKTVANLTAKVTDKASGAVKSGVVVNFDAGSSTTAVLSNTTATTGSDGLAKVTLKNTQAESVSVTASAQSQGVTASSSPATITFTSTATNLKIALSTPAAAYWTDGWTSDSAKASLVATVTDDAGKPVKGQTVTLTPDSDLTAAVESNAPTDANGKVTIDVSSTARNNPTDTSSAGFNLKACAGTTTECQTVTLPFYAPPKVVFDYLIGDRSQTTLPKDRLQHGQFQLEASGGDGNYAWTSSASKVELSGTGKTATVTLEDNVGATISVTTLGRTTDASESYVMDAGSRMLYVDVIARANYDVTLADGALPAESDVEAIVNAWGGESIIQYAAYKRFNTGAGLPIWTNDTPWSMDDPDNGGSTYDPVHSSPMYNVTVYSAGEYVASGYNGHIR